MESCVHFFVMFQTNSVAIELLRQAAYVATGGSHHISPVCQLYNAKANPNPVPNHANSNPNPTHPSNPTNLHHTN